MAITHWSLKRRIILDIVFQIMSHIMKSAERERDRGKNDRLSSGSGKSGAG